jgi:hypothetical protein
MTGISSNTLATGKHHLSASTHASTRISAPQKLNAKPQQLFLTRAHGAVFNVKNLKSVVVKKERPENENPLKFGGESAAAFPAQMAQKDMVQKSAPSHTNTATPSADSSFDGLDFANWGAGHPPDENGDVGPNYYIQTVNTSIGIYDKSNGNRVAAFTFNTFMSQGHFGNLCDTQNFGDPVVLYDSYEGRWFISDFAFTIDGSGNLTSQSYQCFAVSKTNDPVNGGWNYYSITAPTSYLGDYPKFGVWPDGIYMSANLFNGTGGSYSAYHVWALNKQQMYANAPTVSVVDFSGTSGDFTVIPANSKLAAGAPPAGSPEYFVSTENWLNQLSIYKFAVNWDKVSTSTFTGPYYELAPNCWPNATPANASTPANAADPLVFRAMFAPEYTNIGGQESIWVSHTVQRGVSANNTCNPAATTGGNATVRWYQANVTGGTIATNLTQGSSFDPEGANTYFRFSPALAVDRNGDMGITYTKSNSTTNPQIMFDGRLAGDTANTLGTENTLMAGTGAQSGNCGSSTCIRWGDYAGMELDPDGCEFWMTGEYYATSGLNDLTRIGSFHYPSCTPVGNGTISGTVTDGTNPISGATVALGSRTATTDGSGNYSFTVPAGTYLSETADQPGYNEGTASSLVVPDGGSLTQNFTLSTAVTSNCLTDASQSAFQRGLIANCDLTTNPGKVQLSAPDNTDTKNSSVSPTGFGFNNTSWAAQTFTPTISGSLKQVGVELFCSGCTATSPNVTFSIRATSGTTPVPTGADLATGTYPGFNDGGAGGIKLVTLTTPLQVTAGTRYAIVFRLAQSFSSGTMAYTCSCATTGYSNTNPYANGQRATSTTSGASWTADTTVGGRDLNFITYINPGFASSGVFTSSIKDANPAAGSTPHWATLDYSATTPANTGVKFQVAGSNSQFGPWNYVGPDGTVSTYYTTTGGDLSQFNGDRYIRYQATLTSSNTGATPTLNSVTTCFTDATAAAATTLAPASASGTYGGTTTLSATLTSGGNGVAGETVNFSLNGSSVGSATTGADGVATLNDASLAGIHAGSYPTGVSASFAGDSNYLLSSGTNSLSVAQASQAIVIGTHAPATANNGDQFTVAATGGGSGNAIVYGSSGSCSNTGATYTMTSNSGTCTVTYDQAGTADYSAAPELSESVNATGNASQTITVTTHAPSSAVYGTGFTVAATGGDSGNPIVYGSSGSCSNTGADFTMTSGTGTCTVTYDQAGSAGYNAATQVVETVTAQKADQTITVTTHAPSSAAYNSSFDVAAGAPGGAVSYSSSTGSGADIPSTFVGACSNTGSHFTMASGTGTCVVHYNQAGDSNYNAAPEVTESVTATKIDQSITFAQPSDQQFGTPDFDPGATASSGYAVSYGASGNCSIVSGLVHLTGAGSCTVTADQAGDSNYNAAPQVQRTFAVTKADQAIVIGTNAPSSAVFGTGFTVGATGGGSGNPVTYGSIGSCSNTGADFTMTSGGGTCTVTYDQAGDSNYNAATQVTQIVTAQKADQTISISTHAPSSAVYGTGFTVAATGGGSGGSIVYGSSGGCSNTGADFSMTSGSVDCTVTYDQAGDSNYNAAPQKTESVTAQKASQAIHFTTDAPASAVYGTDFTVAATGGASGNAVTYGSSGSCSNTGAQFTMTSGIGTCVVSVDQAGDSNYSAAPQQTESVTADKADQTIHVATGAPASAVYGSSFDFAADSPTANVSYSSGGGCSNVDAHFTMTSGTVTCTYTLSSAGDDNYKPAPDINGSVDATKASQSIVITTHAPTDAAVGDHFTVAATGDASGNPVVYGSSGACSNSGADYTVTSAGTCTVTYDQAGDDNYKAAPQLTESVNSSKTDQTIDVTTDAPSTAVYGTSFDVAATGGGSGNPVTYGSLGACTNSGAHFTMTSGTGTCTVTFDQAGDSNYNAATQVTETVTAQKADQTITFANPGGHTYGDANFAAGATASSGNAVSYGASGACSIASGMIHLTGAGTCTVSANQAGDSNYNAASQVQRMFAVGKAALSITAGNGQKFYAEAITLGTTGFASSGLVGSDSVSGVTLTSAGTPASAAPGSYPVVASNAVAGPSTNLGNYTITYHNGSLVVKPVGLIGLNGITVATTAGKIDSFNSTNGVYGSSNHASGAYVLGNGALSLSGVSLLGSAGSAQSSVSIAHSAGVSGDVVAGTTVSNSGTVGGTVTQHSPGPPFSATVAACKPFSAKAGISGGTFTYASGNLTVKKGTVKLAAKTYCFHNVTVNKGATLSVTGAVTIKLTGKLAAKGQISSTTNLPGKLSIVSSFASTGGVSIVGGTHAAMTILAPKTSVTIAGGSFFGSVLAGSVSLTGGLQFHADQH